MVHNQLSGRRPVRRRRTRDRENRISPTRADLPLSQSFASSWSTSPRSDPESATVRRIDSDPPERGAAGRAIGANSSARRNAVQSKTRTHVDVPAARSRMILTLTLECARSAYNYTAFPPSTALGCGLLPSAARHPGTYARCFRPAHRRTSRPHACGSIFVYPECCGMAQATWAATRSSKARLLLVATKMALSAARHTRETRVSHAVAL
jgi:hypothetical protein